MKKFNRKFLLISRCLSPLFYFLKFFNPLIIRKNSEIVKTILVFDLHMVGDIVLLIPLLRSIRRKFPDYQITLVAGPWAEQILLNSNLVNTFIHYSAPWVKYGQSYFTIFRNLFSLIKNLRSSYSSIGIDVRGDFRQIFLLWLSGANQRISFDFSGGGYLLTDIVHDSGSICHLLDHNRAIANHLCDYNLDLNFLPTISLSDNEVEKSLNIAQYIGFHFGASQPLRRLPINECVSLLCRFSNSQYPLMLFKTAEQEFFEDLIRKLPDSISCKVLIWEGNLRDFIVTLSRARYFYSMDSGPAHISAALNIPTTVFFGPALSTYVKPIGQNIEVCEYDNIECRPCNSVICNNEVHQKCFQGIITLTSKDAL